MAKEKQPKVGDYWCMGLLTSDFLEVVQHAARVAVANQEEVRVEQYEDIGCLMPLMREVVVIRKPFAGSDHVVA